MLAPERARILGELRASFPNVRGDWLEIAASQRARVTLLTAYVEAVGVFRHRGHGTTYPAVDRLQREETAYAASLARIEAMQGEAGTSPAGALQAHLAEHYGDNGDGS